MGEQSMADNKTIERTQQEVVSANKDRLYQATLKDTELEKVKAIFRDSNGLTNISESNMKIVSDYMLK